MPDISLCADYKRCPFIECERHAAQYRNEPWQSWMSCAGTEFCPKWREKNVGSGVDHIPDVGKLVDDEGA